MKIKSGFWQTESMKYTVRNLTQPTPRRLVQPVIVRLKRTLGNVRRSVGLTIWLSVKIVTLGYDVFKILGDPELRAYVLKNSR